MPFQITQALDVFSREVQQRDLTYFTQVHESNEIISLFGSYFMALDWDFSKERLYGFESFTDNNMQIDLVAALPDNRKVLFYNKRLKKIYNLTRQKQKGENDRVREFWSELRLAA